MDELEITSEAIGEALKSFVEAAEFYASVDAANTETAVEETFVRIRTEMEDLKELIEKRVAALAEKSQKQIKAMAADRKKRAKKA